jgi:hypothetical protein
MIKRFRISLVAVFSLLLFSNIAFCSYSYSPGELLNANRIDRSKYYVGLNAGMNFYFGDLTENRLNNIPIYRRYGLQINMEREIYKWLRLSAGIFKGNIIGEEHTADHNLNFSTSLLIPGFGVMFKLSRLFESRNAQSKFNVWLYAGIGCLFFNPSSDLKNGAGQTYYYWTDATTRDIPMNSPNSAQAVVIDRDYHYETDDRKLNQDNVGSYPRSTTVFPVGLSFETRLHEAWRLRIGGLYHFTRTDFLDNISSLSLGSRKGNTAKDKFLFVYAGLVYNIPVAQKLHTTVDQCTGIKQTKVHAKHMKKSK